MHNTETKTNTVKKLLENVLIKTEGISEPGYTSVRKVMDQLFQERAIKEILFKIQDSHVTCTVSYNPDKLELPKYFEQDAIYHQTTASGKTEQEAFYSALSKMAIFTKLS